jgi:hypothetical protein
MLPLLLPLFSLGFSTAGSFIQHSAAAGEANQTQNEQDSFRLKNKISAVEATRLALADINSRELEEMLAAAVETNQMQRDTNSAVSTAVVAAAEAGVSGESVEALLTDIANQGRRNQQMVATNLDIRSSQLYRERQAAIARGTSQANNVQPVEVRTPSPLVPLFDIATDTLSTVDYLRQRTAKLNAPVT